MGQVSTARITILIICFCLTSLLIYLKPAASMNPEKQVPLSEALSEIPGWHMTEKDPVEEKVASALELDDYVNQTYSNGKSRVSLYIGYYLSSGKVGAAHSPLVCFPGQGWNLSKVTKGEITAGDSGMHVVNYSEMIAQRDQEEILIMYWFQSYDNTNPDTFKQKISLLLAKYLGKGEDNAFVRITIPLKENDVSESRLIGSEFIRSFYPVFLSYVKQG